MSQAFNLVMKGGKMKKSLFLVSLLVISVLTVSLVMAFWPFTKITGQAISLPSPTVTCADSDGGNNKSVAGAIIYSWRGLVGTRANSVADSCEGTTLIEYYCQGSQAKKAGIMCDNGCISETITAFGKDFIAGKCNVSEEISDETSCRDSDNGVNASSAGVTIGSDELGSFEYKDICLNERRVREFACTPDNKARVTDLNCVETSAGKCRNISITFEGQTYNNVGYCQPQTLQCSETDGGKNATNSGITTEVIDAYGNTRVSRDICEGTKKVKEFYCNNTKTAFQSITCEDFCINGACTVRPVLCTDSDGGYNITSKGTVTIPETNTVASDFCLNPSTLAELGCELGGKKGGYVSESKVFKNVHIAHIKCLTNTICSDGACRPRISPT